MTIREVINYFLTEFEACSVRVNSCLVIVKAHAGMAKGGEGGSHRSYRKITVLLNGCYVYTLNLSKKSFFSADL